MKTEFGRGGKVANNARESQRWIEVINASDVRIPPHAPCYFLSGAESGEIDGPLHVSPFIGNGQIDDDDDAASVDSDDDTDSDDDENDGEYIASGNPARMVISGPNGIEPKMSGRVTMDWPAAAKVNLIDATYGDGLDEDAARLPAINQPIYIDTLSTGEDEAVDGFTNLAYVNFIYRNPNLSPYRRLLFSAMSIVGVVDAEEGIYWVNPSGQAQFPQEWVEGTVNVQSQELIEPVKFSGFTGSRWFGKDIPRIVDGDIVLYSPGVYDLGVFLAIGAYQLSGVDEVSENDYAMNFKFSEDDQHQSVTETRFNSGNAAFGIAGQAKIVQTPFIKKLNCPPYGECPTMDVGYPAVTSTHRFQFRISVDGSWSVDDLDDPPLELAKLTCERVSAFSNLGTLPDVFMHFAIQRSTHDGWKNWRGAYFGTLGFAGYGNGAGWGW